MKTRETQGGPPSAAVVPGNAVAENPPTSPTSPTPASTANPPPRGAKAERGAKASRARSAAKRSGKSAKATGAVKPGARGPARRPGKAKASASKPTPKKRDGLSGLDAAARVLTDSGKPMRCKEIVERVFARGLWKTGGKTPAATINAAMIREIRDKGKQSRFRKAGRGLFASAGKGR